MLLVTISLAKPGPETREASLSLESLQTGIIRARMRGLTVSLMAQSIRSLTQQNLTEDFSISGFGELLPPKTLGAGPEGINQIEQYQYGTTYYETKSNIKSPF
jgi:hypothetical protein